MEPDDDTNPYLQSAFGMFEDIAPGGMDDPEAAVRSLIDQMGWLIISPITTPTPDQLKALQELEPFEGQNLVQIRQAITSGDVRWGPQIISVADSVMRPILEEHGLQVRVVPLTAEEKQRELDDMEL